ncbi:phytoene desaturase family protein [Glutamicibacter protophormiae]|uniref:phytoene desaturase family protein n=1 Tax=Glutamicibacter protophormiae TaxID=37930 RepID=UPI0033265DDD
MSKEFDAEIVGSGPNGLAAAVVMARAGLRVRVSESSTLLGGGMKTLRLGPYDLLHDTCSAVHPQALNSEFFQRFKIGNRVDWITPDVSFAHAVTPERSILVHRKMESMKISLNSEMRKYSRRILRLLNSQEDLGAATLGGPSGLLQHPVILAQLGLGGLFAAADRDNDTVSTLFAGLISHCGQQRSLAASVAAIALGASAHLGGWPIPRGGSSSIAQAMIDDIEKYGGVFRTNHVVKDLDEFESPIKILNMHPRQANELLSGKVPERNLRAFRNFKPGMSVLKVDYVLKSPVPWNDPLLSLTPTLHLGGSAEQIRRSEASAEKGQMMGLPMVIAGQPTLFDDSRSKSGLHSLWAYCHVPAGAGPGIADQITAQIERFAPDFRKVVIDHYTTTPYMFNSRNANYVGGDILGGAVNMRQLLTRPKFGLNPWRSPLKGVWLASASVAPGPSVHGMAGYLAALDALDTVFGIDVPPDLSPS